MTRHLWGLPKPPIQCVSGALNLVVKRWEREADYSPPSSAEIKDEFTYKSKPQYALMT
jgi:hypothetical protein